MPQSSLKGRGRYMKGLEIAREYFMKEALPVLERDHGEMLPFIAAGLVGAGSECMGYDDEISRDHDFEPGFCLFIPGEETVTRRDAFLLERAYAKLPKEFMGIRRSLMGPVGGNRRGVIRINEFLKEKCGREDGELSMFDWFTVPEFDLLEMTNGEIFMDNYGLITEVRNRLSYYPRDIMLKKLAGQILLMAQSGQYNFARCVKHGETGAAQMAAFEFVKASVSVIHILNRRYQPYYKWAFRSLRELEKMADAERVLEDIITSGNGPDRAEDKYYAMEDICTRVIDLLIEQDLTSANCGDLEKHAYSVNDRIEDSELRNSNILMGV